MFKSSNRNLVLQTGIFLILFIRNTNGPQAFTVKISNCLSRNCLDLYYRYLGVMFLLATVLWMSKPMIVVFSLIPHGKSAACKKIPHKLIKNVWYILLALCSLLRIFPFPFNFRHTKTIEHINVWKRTEAGAGSGAMKKIAPESELQSWTEELRSRAVSFLQLRSPVLVKTHSWSKFSTLCTSVCGGFLRFWLRFGC